MKKAKQPDTN